MARHLVAAGQLIDEEPAEALAHALAARRLASRVAAVREAVGLAAYHSGEWQTAIAELRTYHRMSGRQTHLAVIADSERALGRPERAVDLYRGADRATLDQVGAIELLIVAAGARADMGQGDAAVAMLQVRELTAEPAQPWTARLRYAYADALLGVGRRDEAREWFARAADVDEESETDAAERLLELDGVVLDDDSDDELDGDADGEVDRDGETGADAVRDADVDIDADAVDHDYDDDDDDDDDDEDDEYDDDAYDDDDDAGTDLDAAGYVDDAVDVDGTDDDDDGADEDDDDLDGDVDAGTVEAVETDATVSTGPDSTGAVPAGRDEDGPAAGTDPDEPTAAADRSDGSAAR
ncbi:lipopolysaccharide assembly protein LapB [Plantactinospora sp. KBS50]|uniref:tetratricopeptide repeat protein n=1 Tax=Plantactinospora sp. KBS50 TaxID=2024580 RepID=UPI001E43D4D1|nr:Replicase polyprotein 1ab [Plantactinospora sp. KBS50]